MFLTRQRLEKEREDLIEVITGLTHEKRLAGADRDQIERSLTAHMSRLSQIDFELAALDEMPSRGALIDSVVARMAQYVSQKIPSIPTGSRPAGIRHQAHHFLTR